MTQDFNATRADNERHSHALIALTVARHATLRPDYLATLKTRVYAPSWGWLEAGAIVEVVGNCVRVGGYSTSVLDLDGVGIAALLLVKPYTPNPPEMVVSPATGQLVPRDSGTGRKILAQR
jgi:hypothetical protein